MGRSRTVLHLIDTGGPGGAETIYLQLVNGIDRDRWRSVPVVPVIDWLHGVLMASGSMPLVVSNQSRARLPYILHLRSVIRREGVDLIHAHLMGSALYGSLAAMLSNLPVVCTFHGLPDIGLGGAGVRMKFRVISRRRNRVVFVSGALREAITTRFDLPASVVRVVPNGIPELAPVMTGTEREEMGDTGGRFVVTAVGNVRPAKDYGTLLRAAALLRDWGVPVRLVIIGQASGPLYEDLCRLRRDLDLDREVEFMGFRSDAGRLVAAADGFVSSSSTEGFSLSTVEALHLGRPVVVTRSGGPEEIVRHRETGLLVPVGDPAAIADGLRWVSCNPTSSREMAEWGRKDVRERFSLSRMIESYESLYRELTESEKTA